MAKYLHLVPVCVKNISVVWSDGTSAIVLYIVFREEKLLLTTLPNKQYLFIPFLIALSRMLTFSMLTGPVESEMWLLGFYYFFAHSDLEWHFVETHLLPTCSFHKGVYTHWWLINQGHLISSTWLLLPLAVTGLRRALWILSFFP